MAKEYLTSTASSGTRIIDTSNPPGHETRAAAFLQQILEKEGIACRQFALEPARANLVARVKGNGSKRPVLVMGHTDVVTTQRDKWTFDPFTPTRKNGFIYARGASDDKPHVVAGLMLLKAAFVGITLVVDSYLVTLWGEPLDPMLPAYAVIGLGGLVFLVVYLRSVLPISAPPRGSL